MRAIVIGAGPAGLYATRSLLNRYPEVHVDLIERLPTPFGLIRYGVAPDHPQTKNAANSLSSTLCHPRVSFYGNLTPPADIHRYAHLVINATGAKRARSCSVEGSSVVLADLFAKWMNGHPEVTDQECNRIEKLGEEVVVVGVGNVALDVVRVLMKDVDGLRDTDISERALQVLSQTQVKKVTVVGRKSPAGAAWTTAALREVVKKVPGVTTRVPLALVRDDLEKVEERKKERMLKVLAGCRDLEDHVDGKVVDLRFLYSPKKVEYKQDRVCLSFEGQREGMTDMDLEAQVAFLSLGYIGGDGNGYRVGWANGKASGIIGDNLHSAEDVVSALPSIDTTQLKPSIEQYVHENNLEIVDYGGWQRINEEEQSRAKRHGRKQGRVKLETIPDMLSIARGPAPR